MLPRLIACTEGALDPASRAGFRIAAESALAAMPPAIRGPGTIYRTIESAWRAYFHPPTATEASFEKRGRPDHDEDDDDEEW
jgi:hypothetical protein